MNDISPRGHLAVGCALERGLDTADAVTEHYTSMATHALFIAALEAQPGYVIAANLWNASDALDTGDTERARTALLRLCSEAGLAERGDLGILRAYACTLSAALLEDRPHRASFGPERTRLIPGDSWRSDARFVDVAAFLLSMKEDPGWLDIGLPGVELDNGTDDSYRDALQGIAARCGTEPAG